MPWRRGRTTQPRESVAQFPTCHPNRRAHRDERDRSWGRARRSAACTGQQPLKQRASGVCLAGARLSTHEGMPSKALRPQTGGHMRSLDERTDLDRGSLAFEPDHHRLDFFRRCRPDESFAEWLSVILRGEAAFVEDSKYDAGSDDGTQHRPDLGGVDLDGIHLRAMSNSGPSRSASCTSWTGSPRPARVLGGDDRCSGHL